MSPSFMNNLLSSKLASGSLALAFGLCAANFASAQSTINALDSAANYGSDFDTGMNGGYGFGAWTLNTPGGGHYVGGGLFGLWNNAYGAGTGSFANRSLGSALSIGQTFSISLEMGSLKSSLEQAGFNLEDSSGDVLFSYWQQGGNNANGDYIDAGGAGTATGFAYDYTQLDSFTFTLDSATSYTFTDLATSASFNGTLSGTVSQLQVFRDNLAGDPATGGGGGTDFRFNNLEITTVPEPSFLALAGMGSVGMFFAFRRRLA
jgi:hypothetical protein